MFTIWDDNKISLNKWLLIVSVIALSNPSCNTAIIIIIIIVIIIIIIIITIFCREFTELPSGLHI